MIAAVSRPPLPPLAICGQIEIDDALFGPGTGTAEAKKAALAVWRDALADIPAPYALHGWQQARMERECERFRPTPAHVRRCAMTELQQARARLAKDQRDREDAERARLSALREDPAEVERRRTSSAGIWAEVYGERRAS